MNAALPDPPARPRLLFLSGPWDHLSERVRVAYIRPLEALLRQDFDVTTVPVGCDYRTEVERHRPDLAILHTGCECQREPRLEPSGLDAYPEIPRLAYVMRDPFTPTRLVALDRIARWRPQAVFTTFDTSDCLGTHFANAFYLPWWIDDEVTRDYGEAKSIPVSMTGAGWFDDQLYRWRAEVCRKIAERIPFFHAPSLGSRDIGFEISGESYSRLLNRSCFSAGCGSVNHYLTQKLLEIPGSRSCLVTEETAILKHVGFRDEVNCLFVTPENVVAKLEALLRDRRRLEIITEAGFRLVHENHTRRQRRHFIDWYRLWQSRKPDDRIFQADPWGPMTIVREGEPLPTRFVSENPHLRQLRSAYQQLLAGQFEAALKEFATTANEIAWSTEPRVGAAICLTKLGRHKEAFEVQSANLKLLAGMVRNQRPDPVDVAILSLVVLNATSPSQAASIAFGFPSLRHPATNALRWLLAELAPAATRGRHLVPPAERNVQVGETLHVLPPATFEEWVDYLTELLREPLRTQARALHSRARNAA